ncbi:MAG: cation transporter dimerization domain-containing protein, partial [Candidatus Bathyarchaeia archaeon]
KDCHYLRVRRAGQRNFVDAHVTLSGGMTLYQAHSITATIEERILKILPNSDILIHTEPYSGKDIVTAIRAVASDVSEIRDIHGISVKTIDGKLFISYHIELDPKITIASAHEIADILERHIKEKLPNVSTIISHLEPSSEISETEYSYKSTVFLEKEIEKTSLSMPEVSSLHELEILVRDGKFSVTVHCEIDSSITLTRAHEIATKIEEKIRSIDKRVNQVSVHCEPKR